MKNIFKRRARATSGGSQKSKEDMKELQNITEVSSYRTGTLKILSDKHTT